MTSRRAAVGFFVALCLVLCGLVLRRQIAAHPLPPSADREQDGQEQDGRQQTDRRNFYMRQQDMQPARAEIAREVRATVQGQLNAFRSGDGAKAIAYQSRRMQMMSGDPDRFQQMIRTQYPEFGRCRSALYGPVWSDLYGGNVHALVQVLGENGHRAQAEYQFVREDGQLRIAVVQPMRLPD